ncbi:MAG TPA: CbiX/SirB N-terminal domain-containing protein [Phycisphaerae bacterium]|nr:CbiX/SirB N-terminal domain-containing protein [Phycisphaerae bacterium]
MNIGIVIVDHGSRMAESNALLERVGRAFGERFQERFPIVEPAHMEMAKPSIADAYHRCVERGAKHVVVVPYFLGRGKHWSEDIPNLAKAAAAEHPGTTFRVTDCLGFDEGILDILARRIDQAE